MQKITNCFFQVTREVFIVNKTKTKTFSKGIYERGEKKYGLEIFPNGD
jgi:hypothetical protein